MKLLHGQVIFLLLNFEVDLFARDVVLTSEVQESLAEVQKAC